VSLQTLFHPSNNHIQKRRNLHTYNRLPSSNNSTWFTNLNRYSQFAITNLHPTDTVTGAPGSNLDRNTSYPDWGLLCSFSVPWGKWQDSTLTWPKPLPSNYCLKLLTNYLLSKLRTLSYCWLTTKIETVFLIPALRSLWVLREVQQTLNQALNIKMRNRGKTMKNRTAWHQLL
jgi:hypothetical protein